LQEYIDLQLHAPGHETRQDLLGVAALLVQVLGILDTDKNNPLVLLKGASQLAVTEITQPCVHTCNGLFICQLYSLPDLLEEMDCKEDMPLMLPFCIVHFPLTVDNSDMN
jgi:hypothetical protein